MPVSFPKIGLDAWKLYKRLLPYGVWTLPNGDQVLFNRKYEPIRVRNAATGAVSVCDPHWVEGDKSTEYFYDDGNGPTVSGAAHAKVASILSKWDEQLPKVQPHQEQG